MDFLTFVENRVKYFGLTAWRETPLNQHYESCLNFILAKNSLGERLTKAEIRATEIDTYLYLDKPKSQSDDNEFISEEEQKKFIEEIKKALFKYQWSGEK